MNKKIVREWKKVLKSDLPYIVYELKDLAKVPAMIVLEGPLGAGKTTFAQSFIGEKETLSPTYSILSESRNILHADFYRLEKNEDIIPLELTSYLENKQYFIVEWGMKFARRTFRELPETFTPYLMEIQITDPEKNGEESPRNFALYTLHED
jgi:tRNA threonylcarbamoyladenosine biosynthesis protein TsaE